MEFRTRFSDRVFARDVACSLEERRTKSEFADECDINKIMDRYNRSGFDPFEARKALARFGDVSQVPDFMEMQAKLIAASDAFMSLPAAVRKQFDNDPAEFLAAAATKEGQELMVKLGLGKEVLDPLKGGSPAPAAGVAAKEGVEPSAGGGEPPAKESAPTKKDK